MTERTENLIVRLYGLAEFEWCEHHINAPDEDIVVVKGKMKNGAQISGQC